VCKLSTAARRLVIGRPFRSDRLSHTLLPKRSALPVFASDALSSVAYAPEQVFLMLSVDGVAAYALTPWIGLAVAAVMLVVVASYRRNVHAYPSGGGDHRVATTNLGDAAGLVVARVLVSKLNRPTLRAVADARATRPDALEALTVSVGDTETRDLVHKREESDISMPLKVIASPYREITRPTLDYVKWVSKDSPRTVVTVFIPEYVVGHWWEQVLHNQSALRLKGRLLFMPNVMVTSVPWQLNSSERLHAFHPHAAPGDARRWMFD
jgi:hypothetical protein